MWIINVALIFAAIALSSWFLWNYGYELTKAVGVFLSGFHSLLIALGFILWEAVKAAIIAAVVGAVFGLIFFVGGAPDKITQAVVLGTTGLTFAVLMLRALWENLNNLRWSIRNEIRNRYRKR
ncbi:hypothetical protein [Lyngbya aestuarii]|uniref:hypothetical protein n=1 Tax=Lyngbya aestuarii TaxID=118322 RepID=UPI00403DBB82